MNLQDLFAGMHLEANTIDSIRLWDRRKLLFNWDYICKKSLRHLQSLRIRPRRAMLLLLIRLYSLYYRCV